MKLLALDLGDRRIGLAVGDSTLGTALPAGHLDRTKLRADIQEVLREARQRQAQGFVVGIPYLPSGEIGTQARLAKGFIRALREETQLPVHEVDERFTTAEAVALLRERGIEPSRRRGAVDEASAVLILRRLWDS